MKWLLIVLILVVLIVAILLPTKQKDKIKLLFWKVQEDGNQNSKYFSDSSNLEQRLGELENQMERIIQENKDIRGVLKHSQCDIDEIQGLLECNSQEWYQGQKQILTELKMLKDKLEKIDSSSYKKPSIKPTSVSQNNNVFYAKNFRDTLLKVVPREDAQYELSQISTNEVVFKYCGNFETAYSNREAIFDGVCQLIGNIQSATKITTLENGTATLENGKWKVTKKATLKFE